MKRMLFSAAALCLAIGTADANRLQFRGTLKILTTTTACTTAGETYPGTLYDMIFNPPDSASSDPRMGLSLFETTFLGAQNYQIASGFAVGSYQPVVTTAIYRFGFSGIPGVQLKVANLTPATLTATTPSMSMRGNFQNFDGATGCTVSFIATGVLK